MDEQNLNGENPDAPIIYKIVNHLYTQQQIDRKVVETLTLTENRSFSAYIGLINLLYNQTLEMVKSNANKTQPQNIVNSEHKKQQNGNNNGAILSLRAKVLKQYVKFLAPVLPEPAFSLARFEFQDFNKYCSDRGLSYLVRHSRGIYPIIDTKKVTPLPFLPFYEQLSDSGHILVGNRNWEMAKKNMETFYIQEIQSGNMFTITKQNAMIQQNNQSSEKRPTFEYQTKEERLTYEQQLSNGIRLCYILLLGREQQMKQYIENLNKSFQDRFRDNAVMLNKMQILIKQFILWYGNYKQLISSGLTMYKQNSEGMRKQELMLDLQSKNLEQAIILLIKKTIESSSAQDLIKAVPIDNLNTNADADSLTELVGYIMKDDQNQTIEDVKNRKQVIEKLLLLSYVHIIRKLIKGEEPQRDSSFEAYSRILCYDDPQEDPFHRIFLSDQQILQLYSTCTIRHFPTLYKYGSQLTPKIFKYFVENNSNQFIANLDKLILLRPGQRLKILLNSNLIGDVDKLHDIVGNVINEVTFQEQVEGERIIDYLEHNKSSFKTILKDNANKLMSQKQGQIWLNSLVHQWKLFYSYYKQFDVKILMQLIQKYKAAKNKRQAQQNPKMLDQDSQNEQYFKISNVLFPTERPDILFHIIQKLVTVAQTVKNKYVELQELRKMKQRIDQKKFEGYKHYLTQFMKLMRDQLIKQMLLNADPNYITQNGPAVFDKDTYTIQQQKFQDYVWSLYAQIYLMFEQYSRKLLEAPKPEEKQQHRTDRNYKANPYIFNNVPTNLISHIQNQGEDQQIQDQDIMDEQEIL